MIPFLCNAAHPDEPEFSNLAKSLMKQQQEIDQIWHNDGHVIKLRINKTDLEVVDISCPNLEKPKDETSCLDSNGNCIIQWFGYRFGMECNVGMCPANEEIEIAWTLVGEKDSPEQSQVWFMPMTDDVFQAWLISQENKTE